MRHEGKCQRIYLLTLNFLLMSLILTRTQDIRERSPNFYNWEDRVTQTGALDYFMMDSSNMLSPALIQKAKMSIGSVLAAPVINYDSGVSISSSRSVTISDDFNTSAMYTFTFVTYSFGWTETPSAHMNNEITLADDWAKNYKKYLIKLSKTMDTACVASLSAGKTQVFGDPLIYTTPGNIVTADLADEMRLFADVEPIMDSNDISGKVHYIGNPGFKSLVNRTKQNSTFNAVNKTLQLNGTPLHYTNRITNGASMGASFYAVAEGSCGLLYRFEREALFGTRSRTGHEWGLDTLIGLDVPVSTYYYEGVADYSADHGAATADNTRAWKRFFGFSVDVCYVTAYNSDPTTIPAPILAAQVATT